MTVALILLVLIPAGMATKWYRGPLEEWVIRYAGDIASPLFFFFALLLLQPAASPRVCALGVFVFCVLVECSQFLNAPVLDAVRGNFIGRTLLGSEFDWRDFVFYAVGILLALFVYRVAARRSRVV